MRHHMLIVLVQSLVATVGGCGSDPPMDHEVGKNVRIEGGDTISSMPLEIPRRASYQKIYSTARVAPSDSTSGSLSLGEGEVEHSRTQFAMALGVQPSCSRFSASSSVSDSNVG